MRYSRVRRNSYEWVKWVYCGWFFTMLLFIGVYIFGKTNIALLGMTAMGIMTVIYVMLFKGKVDEAKDYSSLINKHIDENKLFEKEKVNDREVYKYYPEAYWKVDKEKNMLYIRFRLSGNKINLRGLEQDLGDRLVKNVLNVYEEHGYIEYLFELNEEEPLIIDSTNKVGGKYGETQIKLSQSLIWDYRKTPHFFLSGATGVGKSTFARYLISALVNRGVRVVYIDIKRDCDMELYCHYNQNVTYVYEPEAIAKEIRELAEELQNRAMDIEASGINEDFEFGFNPVFLICDEIVLLKLLLPKKLYDEIITNINAIIVGGRSKSIFCGLITQTALAEYIGNSGIRGNLGLKVALGSLSSTEMGMVFGNEFSEVKSLRYGQVGAGMIMRNGIDSRPRDYVAPYIKSTFTRT